jgi:hypothetical protein
MQTDLTPFPKRKGENFKASLLLGERSKLYLTLVEKTINKEKINVR